MRRQSSRVPAWRRRIAGWLLREQYSSGDMNTESPDPDEDIAANTDEGQTENLPLSLLAEFAREHAVAVLFAFLALLVWSIERAYSAAFCDYFDLPSGCGVDLRSTVVTLISILASVGFIIVATVSIYRARWRSILIISGILFVLGVVVPEEGRSAGSLLVMLPIVLPLLLLRSLRDAAPALRRIYSRVRRTRRQSPFKEPVAFQILVIGWQLAFVAIVLIFAAALLGRYVGTLYASNQTEFWVITSPNTTQERTLVFIDDDRIVERRVRMNPSNTVIRPGISPVSGSSEKLSPGGTLLAGVVIRSISNSSPLKIHKEHLGRLQKDP
jgi:hypothetical protein